MDGTKVRALGQPFPDNKIKQKRGQGQRLMNYVSHGIVTERLNDVDPGWSWRTIAEHTYTDAQGRIHCEGVTVELTVCGVTHVEVGGPQRQDGFANEIKNAYSDALKRAAMRFGVALSMWETLVDAEGDEDAEDATVTRQDDRRRDVVPIPGGIAPESVDLATGEIIPNRGPAASPKQIKWIRGLGKGRGYVRVGDDGHEHTHEEHLINAINREFGTTYTSVDHLSKADASRVIDSWAPPKEDRQQQAPPPTPIRQDVPVER